MTELQNMLLPYIEKKAKEIMNRKEEEKTEPICATDLDLIVDFRDDVLECMRELHRQGKFKASRSINYPMLLRINKI